MPGNKVCSVYKIIVSVQMLPLCV
uniref:Uncharacterized protein n=1 Tax=Anguilla anguilla TaxID=7936 RepID=A0A0E9V557_ANGAN